MVNIMFFVVTLIGVFEVSALRISVASDSPSLTDIYSPAEHPMMPTEELQDKLERYNGKEWVHHFPGRMDMSDDELFVRHFPVETKFFESYGGPNCARNAYSLPPPNQIGSEPKFICGKPESYQQRAGCEVFSIGSNGQTRFEEYMHKQAPGCRIDVFDPTLNEEMNQKVQKLQEKGVFNFHNVGLNWRQGKESIGEVETVLDMFRRVKTKWVDYLKIDCEGCEYKALPQFLEESTAKFGHVPVTQIQFELHVEGLGANVTQKWAEGQDRKDKHGQVVKGEVVRPFRQSGVNRDARHLLHTLEQYGFVPFHIDFTRHPYQCCGVEYSLFNTKAPKDMLPKF